MSIAVFGANQPPVAVASASPTGGSAPLAVQFSADGSADPDGIIASYAWDFGDGSTSFAANPAHTYDAAGTYQAILTVTDNAGAMGSDSVTISVSGSNQPPLAVASASPTSGSAPLAVQFSADGSADPDGIIVSYAWTFGDGSGSTEANPAYTYSAAGTYQATLTVTDDAGATASDSVTISVSGASQNRVHVDSQEVQRKSRRGRWYALDKIVVVDQNGQPVADALVTARFYGPTEGQASRTTNGSGKVILASTPTTDPQGTWCFEILSIEVDGYVYDASANVVTIQCEG
ncbi:MAG: PKD domain-containing protein [Anaerolineae bacterium]